VRESPVREVEIEELDRSGQVPFRAVCWLEGDHAGTFEDALAADRTVADATQVVETSRGKQYSVRCDQQVPEGKMYDTAIEEGGIFVSGTRSADHWTVQMRFPDSEAFSSFRDRIEGSGISLQSVQHGDDELRAKRYDISEPQREILHLASERGYFDVPRRASLADLAEDLDVSSQAASERLRRGLDSLVEGALLTPD
jgi:predicted DNA binding protein